MKIPDMDHRFTGIREMSLEVVEETLLILQESQRDFLLELIVATSRWTFSGLDLLQGF